MDSEILKFANIIKENGGNLYLVGGAVRDKLLEIKNGDEDYCVTGISHNKFIELFPNAFIRGKSFEVFDYLRKRNSISKNRKKNW